MRRSRSDSASVAVNRRRAAAEEVIQPPSGLSFDDDRHKLHYEILASARANSDWRIFELSQLHRAAQCLADVDRYREIVASEGDLVEKRPHPLLALIDTREKASLSIMRFLGLGQRVTGAKSMNSHAPTAAEKRAAQSGTSTNNVRSLLA